MVSDTAVFAHAWATEPNSARTGDTVSPVALVTASTMSGIHTRLSAPANPIALPRPDRPWRVDASATSGTE